LPESSGREQQPVSRENVQMLRQRMSAAQQAFNGGDFETAFAALAPDVEWHFGAWLPEAQVLTSRQEVVAFYSGLLDSAGDWQVEVLAITDASEGRFVVHQRGRFKGRSTKITGERESFFVWERGADGLVTRVREYETRAEALEAAAPG
jgi:hypothetical protein